MNWPSAYQQKKSEILYFARFWLRGLTWKISIFQITYYNSCLIFRLGSRGTLKWLVPWDFFLLILVQIGLPNNISPVVQKNDFFKAKCKMAAMKYWIPMDISPTINIFNKHKGQNLFKMQIYIHVAILKIYDENK